jgi:uncharacterized protein YraI
MKRMKNIFSIALLAALALQACNLQLVEGPQGGEDVSLLQTITAQALILEQAGWTATPIVAQNQVIIVVTATADGAASATPDAALPPPANAAPPSGAPTVTVSTATNCRTGPGQAYPSIFGLPVGQIAEVTGKNTSTNYWIIKIPNGAGTCWLWGQYATVTGDTSALPTVAIPPTPTATITPTPKATNTIQPTATNTTAAAVAPNAPQILASFVTCSDAGGGNQKYAFEVTWADKSDNETMFIITTSANGLYSKGPNATFFAFFETLPAGTTLTLNLVAQNATGSSAPVSTSFSCP